MTPHVDLWIWWHLQFWLIKIVFPHIFDGQNYSKNRPFYFASLQPGRNTTSFRLKPWLLGEKLAKVRGISTANVGEPWGLNQPNMELEPSNFGISSAKCGFQPLEPWKFEDQESSCRGCRVTTSRLRLCSTNYQCFSTASWNVCMSQAMLGALEAIPSRVYIKQPHSMIPPINGISPINFFGVALWWTNIAIENGHL